MNIQLIETEDEKFNKVKHDLYNIVPSANRRCVFVGASGAGKNNLIANLLCVQPFKNYFNAIHMWSPNATYESINHHIQKCNPESKMSMYDEYDPSEFKNILTEIYSEQAKLKQKKKRPKKILIIIDDFITNKMFMKSNELNELFITSRKKGITLWLLSQKYNDITILHRLQCEHLCIFNMNQNEIKKIAKEQSEGQYNEKFLQHVFNKMIAPNPYSFLHINKKQTPDKRFMYKFEHYITHKHTT